MSISWTKFLILLEINSWLLVFTQARSTKVENRLTLKGIAAISNNSGITNPIYVRLNGAAS